MTELLLYCSMLSMWLVRFHGSNIKKRNPHTEMVCGQIMTATYVHKEQPSITMSFTMPLPKANITFNPLASYVLYIYTKHTT